MAACLLIQLSMPCFGYRAPAWLRCCCACASLTLAPLCGAGKIRIYQFRGEEDQANVRVTDISANQAGYIQQGEFVMGCHRAAVLLPHVRTRAQVLPSHGCVELVQLTAVGARSATCLPAGAYHFVENISSGTTKFLQIFDHPQGGAVFAAPALVALRNAGGNAAAIVNSAFSSNVLGAGVTAKGAIINVAGCNW